MLTTLSLRCSAAVFCLLFLSPCAPAQVLNEYQWKDRVLVLFTPAPDDPLFQQQYALLNDLNDEMRERDLAIVMVTPKGSYENTGIFEDEERSKAFYDFYDAQPYQFELALIGLDGKEKFRARNTVTPPTVIFDLIDRMPMRRRQILQGLRNKSQISRENDNKPAAQRY